MRHYFYFKKGQIVPQWMMSPRHAVTGELLQAATFTTNGKVMVDDHTCEAVLWAASKRNQSLIRVDGRGKPVRMDTLDTELTILSLLNYGPANRPYAAGTHFKKMAPLVSARRSGIDIRSTTKCLPIPEQFTRLAGGAA